MVRDQAELTSDGSAGPDGEQTGHGGVHISDARLAAADALRRLGHAFVAHDADDELFGRLAVEIEALAGEVAASPARRRPTAEMKRQLFTDPPPDGGARLHFPDCIVSGPANPMGMAARVRREGDDAVLSTALGAAFEGAPGRAHGGAVAALFDEVMGFVLSIERTPAYTGRLAVTYRAPTELEEQLELRARLKRRDGRKLYMVGEARQNGRIVAEAEALFIAVDPDHFATGGG
ncbi:MAG: PaaI family thioesterase [Acidimicrobiales bacterium]